MTSSADSNPPTGDAGDSTEPRPPVEPVGVLSPPAPPPGYGWPCPPESASTSRTPGVIKRVVTGLVGSLLVASIVLNVYLGMWFSNMMAGPSESTYTGGEKSQRIVVLPVNGMIGKGTAQFVHDCLEALRKDKPRAVVLRVDSGGGGVSASDRVWHELVGFKEETGIPIVASFGAVAASGGYYIASPADFIIAEPTSITGSIGVIAQAFTVDRLLDKIGVQPELIVATDAVKKDMLNPMRGWTDEDRRMLRGILDQAHARFVEVVAQGRKNLNPDQVKQLATGEVYTAGQAQDNMLIDGQGYLGAAIAKAKELAGIDPDATPLVTVLSPPRGLGLWRLPGTSRPSSDHCLQAAVQIRHWLGELDTPRIEYRWIP